MSVGLAQYREALAAAVQPALSRRGRSRPQAGGRAGRDRRSATLGRMPAVPHTAPPAAPSAMTPGADRAGAVAAAGHPADHHRPVPARAARADRRLRRAGVAGAADADHAAAGLRRVATGVGPAVGPLRPPAGAAAGPGRLHAGVDRLRAGAVDAAADRLAHGAGRGHGRGRDGRARHRARPVHARDRRARDVQGHDAAWASSPALPRRWAACCRDAARLALCAGGAGGVRRRVAGAGGAALRGNACRDAIRWRCSPRTLVAHLARRSCGIPTFLTWSALSTASYAGPVHLPGVVLVRVHQGAGPDRARSTAW